jgi:hypothetical protein
MPNEWVKITNLVAIVIDYNLIAWLLLITLLPPISAHSEPFIIHSKAWNKRYRIAVCDVKYTYCDTTLHSDLQKKKIKYDPPPIHFSDIKMQ